MTAINTKSLKGIPFPQQVIIGVLPALVIIIAFVFLVYMPKHDKIDQLNVRSAGLTAEIVAGEENVKRVDALIAENKVLKKKLTELRKQLPQEKEVSGLLKQISELGLKSGLDIILWKPQPRKTDPEGLYVEIPVRVEVVTGYHQLGAFFSHISRLQRLVNISGISLEVKQGERGITRISSKFMARTFASAEPDDQAVGAAQ